MTPIVTTDTALVEVLDQDLAERLTTAFGHYTVGDLLHTLPRRYRQHGQRYDKRELVEGERVTVIGTVSAAQTRTYSTKSGQAREMLTLTVEDGGTAFRVGAAGLGADSGGGGAGPQGIRGVFEDRRGHGRPDVRRAAPRR